MEYELQNSFEISDKIKDKKVAILPIGAVEAHGPHLPLGTDNILAERISKIIAVKANALVLPVLPYGQVWSLEHFSGSINISNDSLIAMLVDIGSGLYQQGIKIFVMITAHLGNETAMKASARKLIERYEDYKVFYFSYPGMKEDSQQVMETPRSHQKYFHACEIETSFMLYMAEEYVDMKKAIKDIPQIPPEMDYAPTRWSEFTQTAVLGDATLATKEKGKYILDSVINRIVKALIEAKEKNI